MQMLHDLTTQQIVNADIYKYIYVRLECEQIIQSESKLIARIQQKICRTYVSEFWVSGQSFAALSRLAEESVSSYSFETL